MSRRSMSLLQQLRRQHPSRWAFIAMQALHAKICWGRSKHLELRHGLKEVSTLLLFARTPNALPGKNSPMANKHLGNCFDRVKLITHMLEVITPARARMRAGNQGCKDLLRQKHIIIVCSTLINLQSPSSMILLRLCS